MNYLTLEDIKTYIDRGKEIDCFIGFSKFEGYPTIVWYSIAKNKNEYIISKHEVFDEAGEIDSVYDFTYVDPDEMYGSEKKRTTNFNDIIYFLKENATNKFSLFGNLDEVIESIRDGSVSKE